MAKATDQEFVSYVVKQIVNNPEAVEVSRGVDEMGVLLTLKVHPDDMSLVIGRRGATAKAIRTLARIIGLRNHARVNFRIAEPEGSERGPRMRTAQSSENTSKTAREVDDMVSELNLE